MKIPHTAPIPIAECPDEVLEQIAHAGDWYMEGQYAPRMGDPWAAGAAAMAISPRRHRPTLDRLFVRGARWAARKLGVEVSK